jgi:16S rRNA (guanine527-N7)-methyltransferase
VADIGSGAGLPGITLALRRPDLRVILVEPLLRRVSWLEHVVADLALDTVEVRRARAQDLVGDLRAPFVTARAVAGLEKLAAWGLPLVGPGGRMLAIKGRSARAELAAADELLRRWGAVGEVIMLGAGLLEEPTSVVSIRRGAGDVPSPVAADGPRRPRRARRRP